MCLRTPVTSEEERGGPGDTGYSDTRKIAWQLYVSAQQCHWFSKGKIEKMYFPGVRMRLYIVRDKSTIFCIERVFNVPF